MLRGQTFFNWSLIPIYIPFYKHKEKQLSTTIFICLYVKKIPLIRARRFDLGYEENTIESVVILIGPATYDPN